MGWSLRQTRVGSNLGFEEFDMDKEYFAQAAFELAKTAWSNVSSREEFLDYLYAETEEYNRQAAYFSEMETHYHSNVSLACAEKSRAFQYMLERAQEG